jgi:hypothetical protein
MSDRPLTYDQIRAALIARGTTLNKLAIALKTPFNRLKRVCLGELQSQSLRAEIAAAAVLPISAIPTSKTPQ